LPDWLFGSLQIAERRQNPDADVFNCKLKMAMLRLARYFQEFSTKPTLYTPFIPLKGKSLNPPPGATAV
jgi:hypothetical protein